MHTKPPLYTGSVRAESPLPRTRGTERKRLRIRPRRSRLPLSLSLRIPLFVSNWITRRVCGANFFDERRRIARSVRFVGIFPTDGSAAVTGGLSDAIKRVSMRNREPTHRRSVDRSSHCTRHRVYATLHRRRRRHRRRYNLGIASGPRGRRTTWSVSSVHSASPRES